MNKNFDNMVLEKRAFINGEYVDALSGNIIKKVSPVDGRDLSGLSACGKEDVDFAVKAARKAYRSRVWSDASPEEKKRVLYKLADLMEECIEELALLDTIETGRSIKNYRLDSIPKSIQAIRWFAEAVDKYYGHAISMRKYEFATITKEPLGVVGIITPWNDPLVVASWKFSPALLMGNSVVIKPAEQSSLSLLKVASLAKQAGLPDGVFNVVPGYGEIAGKELALHQDVNGIFFTGSTKVGKLIMQYAGQSNLKKVGLECGGKSPFIVSNKCGKLEEAAAILAKNIFYNQGQICSAPSRLIIHSDVKKKFLEFLAKEVIKYVPGDPLSMDSEVGCVVSEAQKSRIESYIKQGKESGAISVEFDYDSEKLPSRNYVVPIIFDNVNPESNFAKEEIFGPVLAVIEVKTICEAIEMANDSRYGLAASIWTDALDEAYYAMRMLEAGIVHVNSYGDDDNTVPFGGVKESGIGKDKSMYAFEEYSATKTVWMQFHQPNCE
jgi:acyl-CoA reductase-like NAD-dependent aldehyde dehydrogenase